MFKNPVLPLALMMTGGLALAGARSRKSETEYPMMNHARIETVANPRELGTVSWRRDFDQVLDESRRTGRPVLILFQEIPGCATCVGFGETVLSHPLLTEAIETEFVPLAIYNNRPGADARILARYNEPSWNNPVVRFVDAQGVDLISREDNIWTTRGLAERMVLALEAAKRPVPEYLRLVLDETHEVGLETATFGVHCFWEGEGKLGGLQGVYGTRAGFLDGGEVVTVEYDPRILPYRALVAKARELDSASEVFAATDAELDDARSVVGSVAVRLKGKAKDAPASDQKYYLSQSPYRSLELTPVQAMRVNAALARGEDPAKWLSPRQRAVVGKS